MCQKLKKCSYQMFSYSKRPMVDDRTVTLPDLIRRWRSSNPRRCADNCSIEITPLSHKEPLKRLQIKNSFEQVSIHYLSKSCHTAISGQEMVDLKIDKFNWLHHLETCLNKSNTSSISVRIYLQCFVFSYFSIVSANTLPTILS